MCVSGEDADRLKKEGDSGDHLANKNLSVPSEPPKATDEETNDTAVLKTEKPLQQGNGSAGCGRHLFTGPCVLIFSRFRFDWLD